MNYDGISGDLYRAVDEQVNDIIFNSSSPDELQDTMKRFIDGVNNQIVISLAKALNGNQSADRQVN